MSIFSNSEGIQGFGLLKPTETNSFKSLLKSQMGEAPNRAKLLMCCIKNKNGINNGAFSWVLSSA